MVPEKFADESDRATAYEEAEREYAIAAVRNAARSPGIKPIGTCYYCAEEIKPPRIFCDGECADGYKEEQAKRVRLGR